MNIEYASPSKPENTRKFSNYTAYETFHHWGCFLYWNIYVVDRFHFYSKCILILINLVLSFFFLNRPFEVELLQVKNNIIAYRICDVDQIFLISILFPNK